MKLENSHCLISRLTIKVQLSKRYGVDISMDNCITEIE